ncbi:MAG: RNA polymerase sigma factor [Armatimonas sp.]
MIPTPEWWLLHKAKSGDRDAFGTLYDRHAPRVFQLLYRLTGSSTAAEDLTQETFLTAWQSLSTWQGRGVFGTWLCGIAVNHSRTLSRSQRESDLLDESNEPAAPEGDPLQHLTRSEAEQALEHAIMQLPPACREAFLLVRIEGMRYQEAAQLLNIPLGTVQSRIHRATSLLKISLTAEAELSQKETYNVV